MRPWSDPPPLGNDWVVFPPGKVVTKPRYGLGLLWSAAGPKPSRSFFPWFHHPDQGLGGGFVPFGWRRSPSRPPGRGGGQAEAWSILLSHCVKVALSLGFLSFAFKSSALCGLFNIHQLWRLASLLPPINSFFWGGLTFFFEKR